MKFISYDGEIEICDGAIKIKKGKKDLGRAIKFSDIVSITLKKPVLTAAGCIHIQVLGAKTYSSVANVTHYATDMNAICFRKPQYEEALSFKEDLEKAISEMASSQSLNSLNMDGLRQLKQLLDEGIITQEDFDKKKAQMLGL
ncbi:MAG: SHOCT domain-containing protein [Lachnospiraceae bacterium]|jgi:hypothetical protein